MIVSLAKIAASFGCGDNVKLITAIATREMI
jgi:hypothetical protein